MAKIYLLNWSSNPANFEDIKDQIDPKFASFRGGKQQCYEELFHIKQLNSTNYFIIGLYDVKGHKIEFGYENIKYFLEIGLNCLKI